MKVLSDLNSDIWREIVSLDFACENVERHSVNTQIVRINRFFILQAESEAEVVKSGNGRRFAPL